MFLLLSLHVQRAIASRSWFESIGNGSSLRIVWNENACSQRRRRLAVKFSCCTYGNSRISGNNTHKYILMGENQENIFQAETFFNQITPRRLCKLWNWVSTCILFVLNDQSIIGFNLLIVSLVWIVLIISEGLVKIHILVKRRMCFTEILPLHILQKLINFLANLFTGILQRHGRVFLWRS